MRHDVLPGLERDLGPGVAAALARTAALLRADADALDGWAADGARRGDGRRRRARRHRAGRACPPPCGPGCCAGPRSPPAAPPTDLAAGHVAALDALVTDWHGQGPLHLPGAVAASRACGRLALSRQPRSSR